MMIIAGYRLRSIAIVLLIAALAPANAQGLQSSETVDKIVGSDVKAEEARASADADKVIAAIEKTGENISTVRKTSRLDKVDIVFLSDAAISEGGPPPEIDAKVKEHEAEVAQLRQEIEGNAMLYHAIDSRQVLLRDVLAVDFDGTNGIVIYAAAKPAQ
ncbi:hypothetical protein SAMN04488498_104296 [Mesorhizobium albiziae]|uniref:Uncharacterized protein n=1 Tax=Neomesorhizobium albiziae TaxID=335020 RepID=A0A1I3YBC3_9HYPH|nr:hypothetical protein GCM10007937_17060 [Mesorhizobium albiziae]SFK28496.1 hypothetical protein SAMN04488498_104296 [Mesorhizobium albiziae]